MTPDIVSAVFITKQPLKSSKNINQLMESIESIQDFMPTHWGSDERVSNEYIRDNLIEHISQSKSSFEICCFQRQTAPKYKAFFKAQEKGLQYFEITFQEDLQEQDLSLIFKLSDLIAQQLKPELGIAQPVWRLGDISKAYNSAINIKLSDIQKYGLKPIGARTWIGKHLIQLIGKAHLDKSKVKLTPTSWQGLQIDLSETPWADTFEELSTKQSNAMAILKESMIFGDYRSPIFRSKQGQSWVPIPE